jgi:hypothetical protein
MQWYWVVGIVLYVPVWAWGTLRAKKMLERHYEKELMYFHEAIAAAGYGLIWWLVWLSNQLIVKQVKAWCKELHDELNRIDREGL